MELRGNILGDRYRLEERIAAGGMGQVWRAADQVLGRQVAVKLLRPEYAEHPETLERFRSEARHAGVLSHPHIAQMYDFGHCDFDTSRDDGGLLAGPYIVMEYVDGPSLAELIGREPLTADLTRAVAAQAAAGLDAAHKSGLVHRDVKPGNLLLTSDGRVKVTDFGVAHAVGSAPITAPGIVMGTSLYMAPERIEGRPGSPASDLYSLGIVMYECLLGKPPFRGTSVDVLAAHLHQALPPLPDWVPDSICDLVARLTAKDPAYRLSDAGLLAARLRTLEPVGAIAGSRPGPRRTRESRPAAGAPGVPLPRPPLSPPIGCLRPAAPDEPAEASGDPGDLAPAAIDPDAGPAQKPGATPERLLRDAMDSETRADGALDHIADLASLNATVASTAAHGIRRRLRRGARRQGVAAALVTVVVAAVGLAAAGTFRSDPLADQGAVGPSVAVRTAGQGTVYVQVPAFHGQSLNTVIGWLRVHGLTPKIAWTDHTGLPTGTVISVTPDGLVPARATVVITTAYHSAEPPSITPGTGSGLPGSSAQTGTGAAVPAPTTSTREACAHGICL